MAQVSVEGVEVRFGATLALGGVSMEFEDGGFFALLGPSGSGKTTLLRAIAGFTEVDGGTIRIGGERVERVPVERRDIGMMFQSYALFPNMSVAENIGFGLRVRKVPAAEEARRVGEALELVQLEGLGTRRPRELSGGQRQRVALARAFVTRPRVLLLDEPLSALDRALRVEMQIELRRIQREIGITTIFVTHDQEEALTLADRIGILRGGRMVQSGPPRAVYEAPASTFVAGFLGEANVLEGAVSGGRLHLPGGGEIRVPDGEAAAYCLRPERIRVHAERPQDPSLDAIPGRLVQRIFAGAMATCVVEAGPGRMKATGRDEDMPLLPDGAPVWLSWAPRHLTALPAG